MDKERVLAEIEVKIGYGHARFPMKHGSFTYQDTITWKERLSGEDVNTSESGYEKILYDMNGEEAGVLSISGDDILKLHFEPKVRQKVNRYYITFPAKKDEHFYGCGETFSKFDLKGEKVRIWVAEHQNAGRITKKILREKIAGKRPRHMESFDKYESYYAQPTVVSSRKYFIHVDSDAYVEMDFSGDNHTRIMVRDVADIYIGKAEDYPALTKKLTSLLGTQKELPDWIYDGIILGMQGGTAIVEDKIKKAKEAGVKIAGVWCQDWEGCRVTKFGYQLMWNWKCDETLYPDLENKIKEWKEEGIHFLGYINPFLAIEKEMYQYASEHGYCVKDKEGKDYLVTITTFPAAMVDLTNPDAYNWMKEIIKTNMIDFGLDGWMADFAEYMPPDCVLFNGEDPQMVHNTWPELWAKLNREAVKEKGKEGEILFFTRAGHTKTIKHSMMMWNGDQHVDWSYDDGIASVIPATLSLAMSGYGVTHSDAGGYTTIMHMRRGKELLERWMEMNVFSPLLRTHEGNQPQNNVQYDSDEELLIHTAKMSKMHQALKPYLKACVKELSQDGVPVMRPLFYHYDEKMAYDEAYEYLLGRDILVAPVLKEHTHSRQVYLPEDVWVHLFTGKSYEGGHYVVEADIGSPAVFVRRDSEYFDEIRKIREEGNLK